MEGISSKVQIRTLVRRMDNINEFSNKSHFLWKKDIQFTYRGDALYWNLEAIRTQKKLYDAGATSLSKVANIILDVINPKNGEEYNLIDLADIDGNSGLTKYRTIMGQDIGSNKHRFKKGDVLFGRLRFYLKNIGIAPLDGVGSSEIRPIRSFDENFPQEYLYLFLRSKFVHKILIKRSAGSNHPRISDYDTTNLPILRIPSEIITKLTEEVKTALSIYESAQADFEEAQKILRENIGIPDTYRKKSFTYMIWKNKIEISKSLNVKYWIGEHEFFKDCVRLEDVTENVFQGKTPPWEMYSDTHGVRILKVRHLSNDGLSWDFRDRDYVNPIFYKKNKEASVKTNDILMASAAHQATYIGKDISIVDVLPNEIKKVMAVAELNVIRPRIDKINPFVMLIFMQQELFYNEIQRQITGQTAHLYPDDISQLPIPKQILIENFSESEKIEKFCKSSLEKKRKCRLIIQNCIECLESEWDKILQIPTEDSPSNSTHKKF